MVKNESPWRKLGRQRVYVAALVVGDALEDPGQLTCTVLMT